MRLRRVMVGSLLAFMILVSMLFASMLFAAKIGRDWTQFPAVAQTDANQDIFVVGDVHGDYQRLVRVLLAAQVIGRAPSDPQHAEWIANRSMLVFTGDLIDKGNHAL